MSGIEAVLTKLASAAAASGLKRLLAEQPVSKAIDEAIGITAAEFERTEGVKENLRTWCESDEFVNLLEQISTGQAVVQTETIVSSFITAAGFYDGQHTQRTARDILEAFTQNLKRELYKSEEGLKILAAREELLHRETHDLIGKVLDSSRAEEKGLSKTRARFAGKVTEIYRTFAAFMLTGGDSIYHHQTLTEDVERAEKLEASEVERRDIVCRGLAKDILQRLGTMASGADNALTMLEHIRPAFGYALDANVSAEYEGMIDALEAIVRLVPRHPAPSHMDMKSRARVPPAITDLRVFILQAHALDSSFRRFFQQATGQRFPMEDDQLSEERVRSDIAWYEQYCAILDRLSKNIADDTNLPEDTW
jgi:hypothetical protein